MAKRKNNTRKILQQNIAAKETERKEEKVVTTEEVTTPEETTVETVVVLPEVQEAPENPVAEEISAQVETEEVVEEATSEEEVVEETASEEEVVEETASEEEVVEETASEEEVVEETASEEEVVEETASEEEIVPSQEQKPAAWKNVLLGAVAALSVAAIVIAIIAIANKGGSTPGGNTPVDTTTGIVNTLPPADTTTGNVEQPTIENFDIKVFENKVGKIAAEMGNANGQADASILTGVFGAEKLEILVKEYGEILVAKEMATLLTHVSKIRTVSYAASKGYTGALTLADYYAQLNEQSEAFKTATGKNPDVVLMSLDGYETYKSYPDTILALAREQLSGAEYVLFESWYTNRNTGFAQANELEQYANSVREQLLTSSGTVNFFEQQLKRVEAGMTTVDATYAATPEYNNFVVSNYFIIVAG